MRIVIFSELFYPHGGGAELATWLYSKLLVEKGFEVTVVTRQFPGEASVEFLSNGMKIFRVPMRIAFGSRYDTLANAGVLASSFIRRLIKESDIVYVPCGWYSVIPLAKIYGKPVVVHMHNYSIVCPTSLMYDFVNHRVGTSSLKSFLLHEIIERRRGVLLTAVSALMNELLGRHYNRLSTLADAIIFVSRAQMDLALSRTPLLKKKSYAIYNPIPNLPLIESERKGIGYFGGRSFVKGFYTLMEAFKTFRYGGVEAYMAMTWRDYKTVRLDNGILVNFMPRINPESVMKKLSIVVVPSLIPEPSPYVLVESMLYGKLIIASNVGGIPEIASSCLAGVKLVEPGGYVAIAGALNHFLSFDLEEINEIGVKNREYILKRLNNEDILKHFIKILHQALDST
ncbi:MAG: glycosyltransferase family 4 protein [Candidatus Bathyarchaeia archaeon]